MPQDPLFPLQIPPATPTFSYPHDFGTTLWFYLRLKLRNQDPALPGGVGARPEVIEGVPISREPNPLEGPEPPPPAKGQACTPARKQWEYQIMAATYANLVAANLAAGWVWGPQGNVRITVAMVTGAPVPLGSCSDWQLAIHRALCALPNIHCWQVCMIRSVWHKAVVIYPKDAFWWRASGLVFDPWFLGGAFVYTVFQWFLWSGLNWKFNCCR